jgi:hypothetical protein
MGNISYRTGEKVSWNQGASKFNEAKANGFVNAKYNNGYKMPVV